MYIIYYLQFKNFCFAEFAENKIANIKKLLFIYEPAKKRIIKILIDIFNIFYVVLNKFQMMFYALYFLFDGTLV